MAQDVTFGPIVDSREAIDALAAISGDRQPLHLDPAFASRTRFGRPIAHGLFAAGVISAALGSGGFAPPDHVVFFVSQAYRYRAPVYPGDALTGRVWRLDGDAGRVGVEVTNQDGVVVLDGSAEVRVEPLREA